MPTTEKNRLSMMYALKAIAKKKGQAKQYAHWDKLIKAQEQKNKRRKK